MNQNIWGAHLWFSLHTITFNYPLRPTKKEKQNYKNFFISMQYIIPCSICKKNYVRHLNEHPIDPFLKNRKKLVLWLIDIHNMVNAETGKKTLSHEVVLKKYEDAYKKKLVLEEKDVALFPSDDVEVDDDDIEAINIKRRQNRINYSKIIFGFYFLFIFLLVVNFISLLGGGRPPRAI